MQITPRGYVCTRALKILVHLEHLGIMIQTHAFLDVLMVLMGTGRIPLDNVLKVVQMELMRIISQILVLVNALQALLTLEKA